MEKRKWSERPITKWEKVAVEAVEKAIEKEHQQNLSTTHGDDRGLYKKYPDGKKLYFKLYKDHIDVR